MCMIKHKELLFKMCSLHHQCHVLIIRSTENESSLRENTYIMVFIASSLAVRSIN